MANLFEDDDGTYHVLINEIGEHSIWPSSLDVPLGWEVSLRSETRKNCLDFIETTWVDMRPKTL
ncbi:MbtH family protein [Polynucleobacter sp. MG-28-Ekke-A2]|uniref:MbtH family protein n=1 Tax=Polynucleobacter sp. MG-28-Ekke-A2 TaxID=3108276 RepID=UPI002B225A28|nr:MbtH family protein [Polynucleobacter sp. MG-28-Ekke-A2]MEA9601525.1 MbtH family protein [Polynucleobacter sp. MG-28-Ekke-A2]